ncbi:MAG: aminoacyl--tRNA ligase-related protein [Candidatus Spechtbacterales bacterium]|nr:aminoacyl--tRNA ligase-related protein [Candidatus Spechtbacterales bacterium]
MKQSDLFTKTRKEAPKDEVSRNAQLLTMAGFVHKEMAGVYTYLPLGLRALRKIENIIREEMNAIGGQEMLMTTLQDPELWKKTDRWVSEDVDPSTGMPWFKTELASGGELGIANTHEEALTNIMKNHIASYKDLPKYPYQIQNKFRNEFRAKSGLMRGREFLMKDLYSFTRTNEELEDFYEKCAEAYMRIFKRAGLGDITYRTFASGGSFSKFSDEFQTLSEAGEDTIYLDEKKNIAVNKEVYTDDILEELSLDKKNLKEVKAIEVGNIFRLGTKFSEALGLTYTDDSGNENPVVMGSYGIGLGRLMGTVVEVYNDENGIIWPEEIAPFKVHLLSLSSEGEPKKQADEIYEKLLADGVEVLYDNRQDTSAGQKFAEADLIGIPYRVVVSKKSLKSGGVEIKQRGTDDAKVISVDELFKTV